jgi:alginate O-acetyltransferase complex protein AlgI
MMNLVITMVVAGLWHGAAWHFAAFGAMWGIGLALQHLLQKRITLPPSRPLKVFGWAFTMLFYLVSLVFFRAPNFDAVGVILQAMAGNGVGTGTQTLRGTLFVAGVAVALIATWLVSRQGWTWPQVRMPAGRLRPILMGVAASFVILVASLTAPAQSETFFYFQF